MPENQLLDARIQAFFDEAYYLEAYEDVRQSGVAARDHFLKLGWRERRKPNRWYSDQLVPVALRNKHPATPPFILFLTHLPGMDEERFAALCASDSFTDFGHPECWVCEHMRSQFDGTWYRKRYPDVSAAADALVHYCECGASEGRNPSAHFDTQYYLEANTDVAAAGINPFVHYLSIGKLEGRKPAPADPVERAMLRSLKTAKEVSVHYRGIVPQMQFVPQGRLVAELLSACAASAGICLSLSHDNYLQNTGGIQKFIADECRTAREDGYLYLHLCPAAPDVSLIAGGSIDAFLVNCTVNNAFIGTFTAREIGATLAVLHEKRPGVLKFAVLHSAMGWMMDAILAIVERPFEQQLFYVHDYFSLCGEYRLLRNGVAPCGAPPLNAPACAICVHGAGRPLQLRQFARYFAQVAPTLLFPSARAQREFSSANLHPGLRGVVVPHVNVVRERPVLAPVAAARTAIRVAYCGAIAAHKGFFHFQQCVNECRTKSNLEFFHFGGENGNTPNVEFVKVALRGGQSSMSKELHEKQIDLVFVGSVWNETFNFVAYEAAAAGAAVIALDKSGNVAEFIDDTGIGCHLPHWRDVAALLRNPKLPEQLDEWRANAAALRFQPNRSFLTKGVIDEKKPLFLHVV